MKITIARIQDVEIPHGQREVKLWDAGVNGLYLRCFASGARSWCFRYRETGLGRKAKIRTLKLGSYPAVSIDAARAAAKAQAALVASGHDPAAIRRESKRSARSTLGTLLAIDGPYERALMARGIVQQKLVLSMLRRGLVKYMDIDIAKMTRLDFVAAINALEDRPGAQEVFQKQVHRLLEWTVNNGIAPSNVMSGWRRPPKSRAQRLKEVARRRAFTDPDIVNLWHAADRHGKFGSLVQLGLLTGMRRGELAGLRWEDVLEDRIILTPERTKVGALHEVPLTDLMRSILDRQIRTPSQLVFPGARTGRAISDWTNLKNALAQDADIGKWSLHDTRRTTRTLMSRLGVAEPIAELAIGHTPKGLVSIYNLDSSWADRKAAFAKVSDHIHRLISE